MSREPMSPCPFCGAAHTLTITPASDLWNEDDLGPYPHSESYAVCCDASRPDGPGGCGAVGGYKPTEAEAVAAWNRRAALAAPELTDAQLLEAGRAYLAAACSGTASQAVAAMREALGQQLAAQPPLAGHTAAQCSAAWRWLQALAVADGAPPEAGVALDAWTAAAASRPSAPTGGQHG